MLASIDIGELTADRFVAVALPPKTSSLWVPGTTKARETLLLTRDGPERATRFKDHVLERYGGERSLRNNNCSMLVLHGAASRALISRNILTHFDIFLVPLGKELLGAALGLLRHAPKGRLAVIGKTAIHHDGHSRTYLVLKSNASKAQNRHQYGPAGLTALEVLRAMDGLDYVLLRWCDSVTDATRTGDLDLLVSSKSVAELRARFAETIGTFPLDVYTEDGSDGHGYGGAPYFFPDMARRMLASARISAEGVRAASADWRYLSFVYHLLFHRKSRRVPPGTNKISEKTFPTARHFNEMRRLALAAGETPPESFDDMEAALKRANAFPGPDLVQLYASRNRFLRKRYLEKA